MRWAARLERALDEGGFTLYHQHILPLRPGAAGRQAEILLRLREPDGEVLPAGLFLAAAERYHLATRIDRWVLETVLAALRRRPALDDVALLSVNLSGQSLSDETFHRFAVGHLERAGAAVCRCLCFEITETAAVPTSPMPGVSSSGSAPSGCGWRSMISVPAFPPSATSRPCRWT
jgi:EAL domain-containing protein (putative c-di-GMP-specific phosphodiesterase class I)